MLALLVIDMQRGLFYGPDGREARHDREGVVRRINALATAARRAGETVIFIQHDGPEGDDFEPGSMGWEILSELERARDDIVVHKRACDSFYQTELSSILESRGVDELLVTGCATEFCVDTTIRAAASLDYHVTAVEDGHTTADRPHLDAVSIIRHHNWVWADLILPHSQVKVRRTQELLDQLAGQTAGSTAGSTES